MENITTGHWIFAGIFMFAFVVYLVWSYRKDLKMHKMHYNGAIYLLAGIILLLFLYFVFKRLL